MADQKRTLSSGRDKVGEDRFVAAIEAIYDAAPDPSHWPFALQEIADCLGDVGAILIWRRDDGGFGTIVSPSLAAAQKDYEKNRWDQRDIMAQRLVGGSMWLHSDAVTDTQVVSSSEMSNEPIYTDFFARHDLRWRASISVTPDPHISVWIAVQRSGRKQPYSDAELTLATRLGRHVEKSLRLSIRLLDAELANLGLGEALTRLGIGIFALDSLGRPVFSNPVGERLLGRYINIVDGRLRLGSADERPAIDAVIGQMLRRQVNDLTADPRPIMLRRARPERPLVVYVIPILPREGLGEQFLTHTRAIVLVIEPEAGAPADPAVVRDVLGITLGEARVASLVAAGMSPRQASERLGITEETTRTVLKRVYGKVGVSRQSELTALLMKTILSTSPK